MSAVGTLHTLYLIGDAFPEMTVADYVRAVRESREAYVALRIIINRWLREPTTRPEPYADEDQRVRELRVVARLWQATLDGDDAAIVRALRPEVSDG